MEDVVLVNVVPHVAVTVVLDEVVVDVVVVVHREVDTQTKTVSSLILRAELVV